MLHTVRLEDSMLVILLSYALLGRFYSRNWGLSIDGKVAFCLQEIFSPVSFAISYYWARGGSWSIEPASRAWILLILWVGHYLNRSFVYVALAPSMRRSALITVLAAILFNLLNGFVNGTFAVQYDATNDTNDPLLWTGLVIFALGFWINNASDGHLRSLRSPGTSEYRIPHAGLFRWVTCANYLGELLEWIGFAVVARNPAATAFVLCTFANLAPRALATHKWYFDVFGAKYPSDRNILIPYVW